MLEGGAVVRLFRQYPNLYGDLSAGSGYNAISRDPEFGYAFMDEFQDRLLFGTDFADVRNETPIIDFLNDAGGAGASAGGLREDRLAERRRLLGLT